MFMAAGLALVVDSPPASAASGHFCNTTPVVGSTVAAPSSPYPSAITVSGLSGTITDVNMSFVGVTTHGDNNNPPQHWPEDMDIMASAPDNSNVILMSDAGGDNEISTGPLSNVNLTFDDQAANQLPADTKITSGTWRPVNDSDTNETDPVDSWPAPAPAPSLSTLLSTFNTKNPNGVWNLWAVDDMNQGATDLTGGWCIDIVTAGGGSTPKGPADFDGDARTDVSVFRPSNSTWYLHGSGGADTVTTYGTSGDIPVPGDYDGNGTADVAVFRPSAGVWFVRGGITASWGTTGDIPVPGDYDGNGTTDIAVFRPSTGTWFVRGGTTVGFGSSGDIPVPGDYDGNGTTDMAVFRPSTGIWYVRGGTTVGFGTSGDIPVPGNYDGNTTTDIAVFRPSTGVWYVQGGVTVAWGTSGDIPVPGLYDANATTDIAVFRPSTGTTFVRGGSTTAWGGSGDVPLPLPDAIRRFFFAPL